MAFWLLKTEPSTYSFADLQRDGRTVWEGISNATALIHLRSMRKGDLALIYHTGNEKAVVGVAEIASAPYPDPKLKDPKRVVVDLVAKSVLKNPVTLTQIKSDKTFAGWDLLRITRLSVVPVSGRIWNRIRQLG